MFCLECALIPPPLRDSPYLKGRKLMMNAFTPCCHDEITHFVPLRSGDERSGGGMNVSLIVLHRKDMA